MMKHARTRHGYRYTLTYQNPSNDGDKHSFSFRSLSKPQTGGQINAFTP